MINYLPIGYPLGRVVQEAPDGTIQDTVQVGTWTGVVPVTHTQWLVHHLAMASHDLTEIMEGLQALLHDETPPQEAVVEELEELTRQGLMLVVDDQDPHPAQTFGGYSWYRTGVGLGSVDTKAETFGISPAVSTDLVVVSQPTYMLWVLSSGRETLFDLLPQVARHYPDPVAVEEGLKELVLYGIGVIGFLMPPPGV